jgi:hypothetical protein
VNASELYALLQRRYSTGYLLAPQVAEAAGYDSKSRLDAVAIATDASRGYEIHGFEIKVSRADLLREIANPLKSAPVLRFLDFFWIVAAKGIVEATELPLTWGLLAERGSRLHAVRRAKHLEPEPITRAFVIGLILRMMRSGQVDDVKEMLLAEYERGSEDGFARCEARGSVSNGWAEDQLAHLKAKVVEFEKVSGVTIQGWGNAGNIGQAVRLVLAGQAGEHEQRLGRLRHKAREIVASLDQLLPADGEQA